MKKTWNRMKESWQRFWETDVCSGEKKHLSQSDRRWLLYWNFTTCITMLSFVILITGMNTFWVNRANNKNVEEILNRIGAYMASATEDEYDKITESLRQELVFGAYSRGMESFIEYIPNTAESCGTCMESYPASVFLVCTNTGLLYSLDLYEGGSSPDEYEGMTWMTFGYDEVGQTSLSVFKSPGQGEGYAEIDYGSGIISLHRMKRLFCDDCIRSILNVAEGHLLKDFVLFDARERVFYPIDSGIVIEIGNYRLETEYADGNYKITIQAL